MERYSGKRVSGELNAARKGSVLAFGDSNSGNRSVQSCNRLGCSGRLDSLKGIQSSNPEKGKYSKPSFHSSSSKTMAGDSSTPTFGASDFKGSSRKLRKENFLSQSSGLLCGAEHEDSKASATTEGVQTGYRECSDAKSNIDIKTTGKLGSPAVASNTRSRRQLYQRSGLENQDSFAGSVAEYSSLFRKNSQAARSSSQCQAATSHVYSVRNASRSSALQSDAVHNRKADFKKKRNTDGESYSAKGKSTSRSSTREYLNSEKNLVAGSSNTRVASVRSRRIGAGISRTGLSEHTSKSCLTLPGSITMGQLLPQSELVSNESTPASSQAFPTEVPSSRHGSYDGQPGSSNLISRSRLIPDPRDNSGTGRTFLGISRGQDALRGFNLDGIPELQALLAFARHAQNQESVYERLLVLETNLLSALGFHDQHRDMRMDIDNMSYEELLALEEKMGTVSTALTEEELAKCLNKSYYEPASLVPEFASCGVDDIKCSICQEEYTRDDEVAKLGCDHRYHVVCIHQWLQRKNWCPVCKAPAATTTTTASSSSSSSPSPFSS